MAIKTFINGQEGGAITFKGDTEPCAVYVNGERQDNISYIPQEVTGENSIEYKSEYKKNIRTMQIDGNTEQYQGEYTPSKEVTIPESWTSGGASTVQMLASATPIELPSSGTWKVILSGAADLTPFDIYISDTQEGLFTGSGATMLYNVNGVTESEVTVQSAFYIGCGNTDTGIPTSEEQLYWDELIFLFTLTLERTESVTVPNPDYPQDMNNAGDNGMSLTLRGKNLFDGNQEFDYAKSGVTKEFKDNILTLKSNVTSASYRFKIPVMVGKTYTVSVSSIYMTQGVYGLYIGNTTVQDKQEYGLITPTRLSITFTATNETLYIKGYVGWNGEQEVVVENLQVEEGSSATEYEPYFEPTTMEIPSSVTVDSSEVPLRMAKVDKADYIEVNRLDGTVEYVRNVAYLKMPHANGKYTYANTVGIYIINALEAFLERAKGICTHSNKVGAYFVTPNAIWCGAKSTNFANGNELWWVGILDILGFTTLDEFNTWLDEQEAQGTPVELIYELETPVTTDITNTDLGQALLNLPTKNQTNIITITSTPSVSKLSVNYAKWGGTT